MIKQLVITGLLFAAIAVKGQAKKQITVSSDGRGDYKTVQAAFDDIPQGNKKPVIVYVKNGIYKEKLHLDSGKAFVTLVGESKFNTVLTYDDHTGKVGTDGKMISTPTSYSFKIKADNFTARDITFENTAGFTAGQAVAVESDGDRAVFTNCRFIGNQDILFTNSESSRQYYKDCYIEGTTDFIFGAATCWFEQCHIHSKKNSHVTAASTPQSHNVGYVFNDCRLTGDSSLHMVSLGRPWRPYAWVIYMHCYIGQQVKAEGWSNWNKTESYKTARYFEFQNYGPGAAVAGRVEWSRQMSAAEAKKLTIKNVLGGKDNWNPELKN
jgi:pectinesterase